MLETESLSGQALTSMIKKFFVENTFVLSLSSLLLKYTPFIDIPFLIEKKIENRTRLL